MFCSYWYSVTTISIHAPARGATLDFRTQCPAQQEFQSTLPRGERPRHRLCCLFVDTISIHAPARGATVNIQKFVCFVQISIHAPARGATGNFYSEPSYAKFQSTLPRGERHLCLDIRICLGDFNPRSREGSDGIPCFVISLFIPISIHAPARGATDLSDITNQTQKFQSTLPRGERPQLVEILYPII